MFGHVADLPVAVEGLSFDRNERETSSDFTRVTTTIELHGEGHVGRGEDVTYEADEHEAYADATFPLEGEHTVASASAALDGIDLFPAGEPDRDAFRSYRRWGFESAVLDLALRQNGTDLGAALGREYDPVRFVVSTRLGDPPSVDRLEEWLAIAPDLEFKLDATADWTDDLVEALAATGRVRILDLKGQYEGTDVDGEVDPDLYGRLVEAFPDALIEDPALTPETERVLDPVAERVTWDVPITDAASVDRLPWDPEWLNSKPSRFGTVESVLGAIEACRERDIRLYGGGQFELDVGRGQLHALASLLYPDAPNDVAPRGYNDPEPREGLPSSPLSPPDDPVGFGWDRRAR